MKSDTGPWAPVPEWVLDSGISDRAVRLYALLGRYADTDDECWPSRRTLAGRMNCSSDSIDRAKQELVTVGALLVHGQVRADGGQTSNLYTLIRAAPLRLPLGKAEEPPLGKVAAPMNESHLEREPSLAPVARPRERDVIFEALCQVTGTDSSDLTTSGRGALNHATKELRSRDATPDEIRRRFGLLQRRYPNAALTAPALVKFWASLGSGPRMGSAEQAQTIEEAQAEFKRLMEEDPL